jgi:acetyl esterase/lipase
MAAIARSLALVLAVLSAAAAALIVLPAPSLTLALAAIVTSEKSALVIGGALVALALCLADLRWGRRAGLPVAAALTFLLSLGAIAISLLPLAQAWQLARAQGVALDLGRYLRAPVDSAGPGLPNLTVPYNTVDDGRTLGLDVYLPATRPATPGRPILIVHGGFWSAGQRGEARLGSRRLADLGFTVFDVEYRLAPQPNWQTALGDVKCAIGWVKRHASTTDWNVDPAKVALLGRSAGGHLVLMAAYAPADPALPPSCDAGDTSVEAVVGLYAPTDLLWGYEHPSNPRAADSSGRLRNFLGGPPETLGDRYRALSPVERVTAAAPRTLLAHGGRDQFLDHAHMDLLAARLVVAGIPHQTLFIPYAQHAFDFLPGSFSSQILEATLLNFLGVGAP